MKQMELRFLPACGLERWIVRNWKPEEFLFVNGWMNRVARNFLTCFVRVHREIFVYKLIKMFWDWLKSFWVPSLAMIITSKTILENTIWGCGLRQVYLVSFSMEHVSIAPSIINLCCTKSFQWQFLYIMS